MEVGDFISLSAVCLAVAATVAAWRAARISHKSLESQYFMQVIQYKLSQEFFEAKLELSKWRDKCKQNNFNLASKFIEIRYNSLGQKVDNARRYFYNFFEYMFRMWKKGLLSESDVVSQSDNSDLSMLVETVIPIQKNVWEDMEIRRGHPAPFKMGELMRYFEDLYRKRGLG